MRRLEKRTVWKFPFKYNEQIIELELPQNSRIIHTDHNNGEPCIWALVNPDNPTEKRIFQLLGTGNETELDINQEQLNYIGTLKGVGNGIFIHVFERIKWVHKVQQDLV
jgi:hypothetical protein